MWNWINRLFHIHHWENFHDETLSVLPHEKCSKCSMERVYHGPMYGWRYMNEKGEWK